MTSSQVVEYLEKYSVAPSPSRDYYGIKVLRDQVILYVWKISHGPHTNPIVRKSRFGDFSQDKTMQNEIERVFGEPMFRYVQNLARGSEYSLVTLPKHLVKKLTTYLPIKDVLKLSTLSRMTNEVFGGDVVWEVLYKRQKTGLIYRDEKEQTSYYGWKRLFRERQMQKPARERKIKKLSNDPHLGVTRSSEKFKKKTPDFTPAKSQREARSATKLIDTGLRTPKSIGSRSNHSFSGRPDTASFKLFSTKKAAGGVEAFPESDIFKTPVSLREVRIKTQLEPKKYASTIYQSKDTADNKATSKVLPENCEGETCSDKTSTISAIKDGKNRDKKAVIKKSNPSSVRRIGTETASDTDRLSAQLDRTVSAIITERNKGSKSSGKSVTTKTKDKNCGVFGTEGSGLEDLIRASITRKFLCSETLMLPDKSSSKKFSKASIFSAKNNTAAKDKPRNFPKTGSSDNLGPKSTAIDASQRLRSKKCASLEK